MLEGGGKAVVINPVKVRPAADLVLDQEGIVRMVNRKRCRWHGKE